MGRKPKYSKVTKVKACEDYISGIGSFKSIANSLGTTIEVVRRWYLNYQIHGAQAFDSSNRNRSYTKEFKESVINEYLSRKYSLTNLSAKYNITYSVIRKWVNKYYNGIEANDYKPEGEVYTMESRKTTFDERLEIVKWVIANNMNYKEAASKHGVKYALVYQWVQKYMNDGADALRYKKRGPKLKNSVIDESSLSEIEKLKLELERERILRERAELRLEILKKKEEFEEKIRSRK